MVITLSTIVSHIWKTELYPKQNISLSRNKTVKRVVSSRIIHQCIVFLETRSSLKYIQFFDFLYFNKGRFPITYFLVNL